MSTYDDIMPDKSSSLLLIPDYGSIVSGNRVLENITVSKNMGKQRQIIASFAGKKILLITIVSETGSHLTVNFFL